MRSFLYRLLIFFISYSIIATIISLAVPYHWGNPWFSSKIQYLEKSKDPRPNTFFFGSSRVFRQVAPLVFDSTINSRSDQRIRSFNLGAAATFTPQTYFLYEQFLNSDLSMNARYCFIELMEVDLPNDDLLHQERTTYWVNFKYLRFIFNSLRNDNQLNSREKFSYFSKYVISYLENILHLGHFGQQLITDNYYDERYNGPFHDGFLSCEEDLRSTTDSVLSRHLIDRRQDLLDHPELLQERERKIRTRRLTRTGDLDRIHLDKIYELIEVSSLHNIRLIFILSPRNPNADLMELMREIPVQNRIDMGDPGVFNEFYQLNNSYDLGHLNEKGALLYTARLALEAKELLY